MLTNPTSGLIKQNCEVKLQIELHKDHGNGDLIWSQNYDTKTDDRGLCNLTLSFPDDFNWNKGPYFMKLYADGDSIGSSPLLSVPYSFTSASIEGNITRNELIGTWIGKDDWGDTTSWIFNPDGSGKHRTNPFEWKLNNAGHLLLKEITDKDGTYYQAYSIFMVSENEIVIGDTDGCLLKKQ